MWTLFWFCGGQAKKNLLKKPVKSRLAGFAKFTGEMGYTPCWKGILRYRTQSPDYLRLVQGSGNKANRRRRSKAAARGEINEDKKKHGIYRRD